MDEKGYVETTIANLREQTLYKKGKVNIILAEYKDQLNLEDDYLSKYVENMEHVNYMPVFQKGIAYARNAAISQAKSNVIVNFDADCIFNRDDAIEKMIHPILNQEAMLTNCETKLFDFKTYKLVEAGSNIYDIASRVVTPLERFIIARGPGLSVSKPAFWSVGGFRDTNVGEDYLLGIDICMRYSIHVKKFIDDVKVFASNRRAKAMEKEHLKVFDYSNAYRDR